jgi:uncharacterized membrane protein
MQEAFTTVANGIALFVEGSGALIVAAGSLEALYRSALAFFLRGPMGDIKRRIWTRYASWLLLGLEFALAGDIIRSAIAPTWADIGQLAAIAAIRTFLNYFLTRDLEGSGSLFSRPKVP